MAITNFIFEKNAEFK